MSDVKVTEKTKTRMEEILEKPIKRNFDQAINQCLDKLDSGEPVDVLVCDQTEKFAGDEQE